MRTLTLSGWGQPHDALAAVMPDAAHFDYTHYPTPEAAMEAIAQEAAAYPRIVGWSLGGQLAVRAIASGLIKPRQLVLIATPFQFVKNRPLAIGMPENTYATFCRNYASHPERTLRKAWELIAHGDAREQEVQAQLTRNDRERLLEKDWQRWLEYLSDASCEGLDWSRFPPTLLVHGDRDAVVRPEQAQHFVDRLPQARLEIWPGCGHAPHWHDADKLKTLIENHV